MANTLYDFLVSESSSSATGGVNTAEGQDPSTVNDAMRQWKQLESAFLDDLNGVNTVTGTGDAIAVTAAQGFNAYGSSAGQIATGVGIRLIAPGTNTGAATLNVNAIGTRKIRKIVANVETALSAGDIAQGDMLFLIFRSTADTGTGAWILIGSAPVAAATTSASGIVQLATQTEAATQTDTAKALTSNDTFFLGGYTTVVTAAGTTTLTVTSTYQQFFTGSSTQTLVLPVTSTLVLGRSFRVVNNSTGAVTVQSSGANTIAVVPAGTSAVFSCILVTGTTAASWDFKFGTTLTLGTPVASTSGTSIDFTGIPAWAKRITINYAGVQQNSASQNLFVQIGDAGGIEATGYLGAGLSATSAVSTSNYTTGFGFGSSGVMAAADVVHGTIVLTLENAATQMWTAFGIVTTSNAAETNFTSGSKSLSPGPLDRVRTTTPVGSATFSAGSINITIEG